MEAGKKCSKRSHSSSLSSDGSRKKGHLKKTKMSSKREHYRAKKCSDNEGDSCELGFSKVERKSKGRKVKERTSRGGESSSFSSSESEKWPKKRKRKEKKQKEKKQKGKKKEKHKREKVRINDLNSENQNHLREGTSKGVQEEMNIEPGPVKPANSTEEPKRRAMAPMTKEEYDKQQSKVRRVFDHDTGRERLIKGEGEIIEEIVSSERHQAINKLSTAGDGAAFQKSLGLNRYDHDNKIYRG